MVPEAGEGAAVVGIWVSNKALSGFYRGVIREVRMWSRVRSVGEIQGE
ncbi:LamG domain-containing protein [Leptothoe spongobia]|uniref:Uncharacterized protein n=1 Tax=Leptothoe spongobia TAU-MAC 1115 TaxID=1967444 RepID=A0A947DGN0_9CYAN|nr:LamG domain-containing protein [Leptothoe spongobia]MBT9316580.1 hypothetical protein [Leptothoe spongobia TAU-MAC 1115]